MSEIIPVILAAGRGSRLGMDGIPKPMVQIAERPLMQNVVESLYKIGFSASEIKAVIGYKGEVIQKFFGADLECIFQKELNGNAGALEEAFINIGEVQDRHILTIQGDDADQATPENLRGLIHFHLSRHVDVSILTVNKPDSDAHLMEYVYDSDGRVTKMIPCKSVDSNGRYTAGFFLFSGLFLEKFIPILKGNVPKGEELGIAKLIELAVEEDCRVFQLCSHKDYISINTLKGLQYLREKGIS